MWDRLTSPTRQAVYFAQLEAQGRAGRLVDPEHLLYGLAQASGTAQGWLDERGFDRERLRSLWPAVVSGIRPDPLEMELSDRGKKAFNEAFESVRQSGDARLGTMHLLVGILRDGRSPAVRALDEVGIDLRGAMIHMSVLSQLERQDGEERVKGLLETLLSRFRR